MFNNAAVCRGGGEIGRAQAVQAEACGLEHSVDVNPVLLKPESENGCQVVIAGRQRFRMTTREYAHYCQQVWPEIVASYNRLARQFQVLIIEGAGGAAEVNLRDRDVVNWRVAELADAPVLIVADVEKGGALAALVGTVYLLSSAERSRVKGLIINKFRGDPAFFTDAVQIIEEKTSIPVLGILPYMEDLAIPHEDSASLKPRMERSGVRSIKITVVRFPRISNYTDFEALAREPDVELQYVNKPDLAGAADLICLPGTKNTVADLNWLRDRGWDRHLTAHYHAGGSILGVCGGYQMLGWAIADPEHVESSISKISGLGLLPIETVFAGDKITALVTGVDASGLEISGYEIHNGQVIRLNHRAAFRIHERNGSPVDEPEGALSDDERILGTSIHGVFDGPVLRRHYLNRIRERKPLRQLPIIEHNDARNVRMRAYNRVADLLESHLNLNSLGALVERNGLILSR